MVYSFKGKSKDLLGDLEKFGNKENSVPQGTIFNKFSKVLHDLGAKNIRIYDDLEGKTRLKYSLENKTFIISIDELYND